MVYTLGGADAFKYTAPANTVITTGEITAAPLTITFKNDQATFGLVGTSVELSQQGIVSAEIKNGDINVTFISAGSVMLKVTDGTNTAGIHLKVDETGNFTTVGTYPYTGMNRSPILVKAHKPLSTTGGSVSGNVALYFVDLENDPLTYNVYTGPAYGSLILNNVSGDFTYTPNINTIVQNDTFTLRVYDPSGGSSSIRVDIIGMF